MTHSYNVTGMTCSSCQQIVQDLLLGVPGVTWAAVDRRTGKAEIEMTEHIPVGVFRQALKDHPKYQISETVVHIPEVAIEDTKSFLSQYKPILVVFAYIIGLTLLVQFVSADGFNVWQWMDHFMAAFFLVFSFFKMLDLKGFAESYFSYDIIARKWFTWGYVYAFIELGLGIAYLTAFAPLITNAVTFIVMSLSIIGVLKSVLAKRKIRCACLGAVFNLPMSTITIIEDALMILMSGIMLVRML